MSSTTSNTTGNDFVIWGPSVTNELPILNAVHALYYLPGRYKLVLPAALPGHKEVYSKVLSLIRRDHLAGRVQFTDKLVAAQRQAIIVADEHDKRPGSIFGDSPEALASAILRAYRRPGLQP
ncbi:MAG TPA: hypothetical protein VLF71_00500 [Candidatus Saccharimonadales bacterium]|nr:hypothetical protein [Candidatus Saccharimonadales bacterium]